MVLDYNVTLNYPPFQVTEDIGSDELIRRLKTLAHTFQTLSQADDESTYADYTPLAIHLADDGFLNHDSRVNISFLNFLPRVGIQRDRKCILRS